MKTTIIIFDGLDYYKVMKNRCFSLQQSVCGRTSLEGHLAGGGHPDCVTDEIFATFLTGTVPDVHGVKLPIDLNFSLSGKTKTILDLCDSVAVDLPSWNRHPQQHIFQVRLGRLLTEEGDYVMNPEHRNLVEIVYSHLYKEKWDRIRVGLNEDKSLTILYFWFTDIAGHLIKGGQDLRDVYTTTTYIFNTIRGLEDDEDADTLYMVMSDHGMEKGHHRPDGAFWSLSKPLLDADCIPKMEDWYWIIEEWLNV